MKTTPIAITSALLVSLSAGTGFADDAEQGKQLHDANCVRCHDSSVYTRPDRKMQSLDQLRAQVQRCDSNLETKLFDDEIEAVVQYLNTTYYKF